MRFFNTEGPVRPENHYHIPPLTRIDLDELLLLVRRLKYFVLHAPRQTGKTSTLLALRDLLNGAAGGDYRCVYVNVEGAQAMRENVESAMRTILSELASRARSALGDAFLGEVWPAILAESGPGGALRQSLTRWAEADPRPLVLLIDEIDTLVGDTLLAVLRQLRAGHDLRPGSFPQSVILCGVRDVRDYRIHSTAERSVIGGGSAFNIKAESLRLGDFSRKEVRSLLAQHTGETGQAFTPGALETIWTQSQGQPWLVNALAYDACFRDKASRDRTRPITADAVLEACEQLVRRRETHLDQLTDKLQEERVRRVIEPLLAGAQPEAFRTDDLEYVRDLGLVRQGRPLAVANPIYREVIPRDLTWTTQETFPHDPAWYVAPDGRLLSDRLLDEFQTFFREHSEHWVERFQYKEAGPAASAPGVLAAHREQRGADRARVRPGPDAGGPADRVAGARGRGRLDDPGHRCRSRPCGHPEIRCRRPGGTGRPRGVPAHSEGGDRMQGAARKPLAHHCRGPRADPSVHGPLQGGGRAPRGVRPHRGQVVGGEGVPARGDRRHDAGDGLGAVIHPVRGEAAESRSGPWRVVGERRRPASSAGLRVRGDRRIHYPSWGSEARAR